MTPLIDELSQRALELAPGERVLLAERLLATVHEAEADVDVDAAWDAEIQRRLAEANSGSAALIAAEDVFAEVRHLLK